MKVLNIYESELNAPMQEIGALIDSLASSDDALWPKYLWPRMAFNGPLGVGAAGGHGPVRYFVEAYVPGASIKFRFTGPKASLVIMIDALSAPVNIRACFGIPSR